MRTGKYGREGLDRSQPAELKVRELSCSSFFAPGLGLKLYVDEDPRLYLQEDSARYHIKRYQTNELLKLRQIESIIAISSSQRAILLEL